MRTVRAAAAALLAAALSAPAAVAAAPASAVGREDGSPQALELSELRQRAEDTGSVPVLVAVDDGTADAERAIAEELDGTTFDLRPVSGDLVAVSAGPEALERLSTAEVVRSIGADPLLHLAANSPSGPPGRAEVVHAAGASGVGRTVAVIDTGVDRAHPALAGALVAEACFLAGLGGSCPNGQPTQVGAGAGAPCSLSASACGHGTHVAGIAVGRPHGDVPAGVAPGAGLVSIRIFDADPAAPGQVAARTSDLIAALEHVKQLRRTVPIDAVNLSISGDPLYDGTCDSSPVGDLSTSTLAQVVNELRAVGVATVTASGNGGSTSQISFPACLSGVLRVAATDAADIVAPFANRNVHVTLAAPGVDVVAAALGGGTEVRSGTSMAAPQISGAIALLRQRYDARNVSWLLARLESTGRPTTDPITGLPFSRVDLPAALGLSPTSTGSPVPAAGAWVVTDRGRAIPLGVARDHGGRPPLARGEQVVAAAGTRSGLGYWMATDRGRVVGFGDAPLFGDVRQLPLNRPISAMAPTASGGGYWLLGADGGIFTFGDARFRGSTGSLRLNAPVTDLAPTPTGDGYWLTGRDGGVFSFGDARFHGSTGGMRLNQPVVSIAAGPTTGYWLVALDGGVFAFDVPFLGSLPGSRSRGTGIRVRASASGHGYHILTADGSVHPFGLAEPFGRAALAPGERAVDLVVLP